MTDTPHCYAHGVAKKKGGTKRPAKNIADTVGKSKASTVAVKRNMDSRGQSEEDWRTSPSNPISPPP